MPRSKSRATVRSLVSAGSSRCPIPGGRTQASVSRSYSQAAVRSPTLALSAWWMGLSTWSRTKTEPAKASGPDSGWPCWTAPTSTPMAMAKAAGRMPRNSNTAHQAVASAGAAWKSAAKNFHSLRAVSQGNMRTSPATAVVPTTGPQKSSPHNTGSRTREERTTNQLLGRRRKSVTDGNNPNVSASLRQWAPHFYLVHLRLSYFPRCQHGGCLSLALCTGVCGRLACERFVVMCGLVVRNRQSIFFQACHTGEQIPEVWNSRFSVDSRWLFRLRANKAAFRAAPDCKRLGQLSDAGLWSERLLLPDLPSCSSVARRPGHHEGLDAE